MSGPAGRWYAVIDGAQDPQLLGLIQQCRAHVCLISGKLDPVLAPALPWLVEVQPDEQLIIDWRTKGAGRNWGIALESPLDLLHVKLHLKKFLNAKLPDGTVALFRFYDPRVLRTYLRAATAQELAPWFSGINRFSVESEQAGRFHDFQWHGGRLHDGPLPVAGAVA